MFRLTHFLLSFLLFALHPGDGGAAAPINSIAELWAGVDPRRDPLEIEIIKSADEGEIHIDQLYFTSETWEGEKVRVFAYRGAPKVGAKLPGVVHMHGGGQTALIDWVRFWAKRGYVCVSFDWCGTWDKNTRPHYAKWGKVAGDMMKGNLGNMKPTPQFNPWYHWMLAGRRALTLLERHPQVDPQRLGFFGISMGGYMTWSIAAIDTRVKAAVAFYGYGWTTYTLAPSPPGPVDNDRLLYRKLIDSEAYAPLLTCPILFMSATNDFCIGMDRSYDTLELVRSAVKRQVYTPHYNHHVEPAEGKDLPRWMDWQLKGSGGPWPRTPGLVLAGASIPEIRVAPDEIEKVTEVRIYYALNNPKPLSRFWRLAGDVRREGPLYCATAPFLTPEDTIYAFANVTYASGVTLSSRLVRVPVQELPDAHPTLRRSSLIDPMENSEAWYYLAAYTDPSLDFGYFKPWTGPGGERGFTLDATYLGDPMNFAFATHKLGDPQWRGSGQTPLLLDVLAERMPQKLEIKVTERHWQATLKEYTASPTLGASRAGWVTLRLQPADFKSSDGKSLACWDEVNHLVLAGTAPAAQPPVFKRLRWQEKSSGVRLP